MPVLLRIQQLARQSCCETQHGKKAGYQTPRKQRGSPVALGVNYPRAIQAPSSTALQKKKRVKNL